MDSQDDHRKRGKSQFAMAVEALALQQQQQQANKTKRTVKQTRNADTSKKHTNSASKSPPKLPSRLNRGTGTNSNGTRQTNASATQPPSQMQMALQSLAKLPMPLMTSPSHSHNVKQSATAETSQSLAAGKIMSRKKSPPQRSPMKPFPPAQAPPLHRSRSRSEMVRPTSPSSSSFPSLSTRPVPPQKSRPPGPVQAPPSPPKPKPGTSPRSFKSPAPTTSPRLPVQAPPSPPPPPPSPPKPKQGTSPRSFKSPAPTTSPRLPSRDRKPSLTPRTAVPPPQPHSPPRLPERGQKPSLQSPRTADTTTSTSPRPPRPDRKPSLTSQSQQHAPYPIPPSRDRKPSLSPIIPSLNDTDRSISVERDPGRISLTFEDLPLMKLNLQNEPSRYSVREEYEISLARRFERQFDHNGRSLDDVAQWSKERNITAADITTLLQARFQKNQIYTYLGSTIVSVNPFKQIKGLYSNRVKDLYHSNRPYDLSPHLYSLGESCWRYMRETGKPQAVVVSGDSGSGKTVACKHLMEYLAAVSISGRTTTKIKEAILSTNHILETFGNARTIFNNNSSRFGRVTDLQFNHLGQLVGAHLTTLTLEKSRVVSHRSGERNFHIMYQLFSDPIVQRELSLGNPSDYRYLNQHASDRDFFSLADDKTAFDKLQVCMASAGFSRTEMMACFRIVAGILQLGNLQFTPKHESSGMDGCDISSANVLTAVSNTLQLESEMLKDALVYRSIRVGITNQKVQQTVHQAESNRDTLAKKIYERLFDWIVSRINGSLKSSESGTSITTISLVDIYGLEIYESDDGERNSFDQLCINYVNEKLKQHFSATIRRDEAELVEEGVPLHTLLQLDCDKCIDLIEGRPAGVFALLDEESLIPQGSDEQYLRKMTDYFIGTNAADPSVNLKTFQIPRLERLKFDLHHFSSWVRYDVEGWLEKNRDTFMQSMAHCMQHSSLPLLTQLFPRGEIIAEAGRLQTTLAQKFIKEVSRMVGKITNKKQHFIKCILPNRFQKSDLFDFELVEKQVRYLGLVEETLIGSSGYVTRMRFDEFVEKYKLLCRTTWPKWHGPSRIGSELILRTRGVQQEEYAIGKSKVFFTTHRPLTMLNRHLEDKKHEMASLIQNTYRLYRERRMIAEQQSAAALFGGEARIIDTLIANRIDGTGNRSKIQVILTDVGLALVDPSTENLLSEVHFKTLNSVKTSPYVDGVVLFQSKENSCDELIEFDNKQAIVDVIQNQQNTGSLDSVSCPVLTEFTFRSVEGPKQVAFIANKLFHKTVIVLDENDSDVILVNTRHRDDLYDGKKMRRRNSFVRRYLGDYIRLGGSDLMKQLQKDYGDKLVAFSAAVCKYNKKAKKQDRLVMITDRALYNLDLAGYMVNRRIPFTDIESCFVSTLPDDFILVKCRGQDLLIETNKKTELITVLQDMYQQENNANLRIHVNDDWKCVLDKQGENPRSLKFIEDPRAAKTVLVPLSTSSWIVQVKVDHDLPLDVQLDQVSSDIYGGLKLRRKESLLAWHMGDYLFLGSNKNMIRLLNKRGHGNKVLFSGLVTKINKRYVPQKRRLVVTEQTVLSLDPDRLHVNREIFINKISGISVSAMKDGFFVIHVNDEYDYVMETPKKTEIITTICKQYKSLTGRELKILVDNKLVFRLANKSQRTIKFKHDPGVKMPTIVPYKMHGFKVKVNNSIEEYQNVENRFTGEEQEAYFYQNSGGQIVARVGVPDRFDSVYGGRKDRARASVRRQFMGDYCRLAEDARMKALLKRSGEKVLFSASVSKINKQYKKQKRILVITNHAVYNIDDDGFKVKRRIALDDIEGVSVSQFSDGIFSLHCPNSYDYLYESEKKTEIIDTLMRATGGRLRINVADQFEYRPTGDSSVSTVSFVLDENADMTFLQPTNQGLVVRVSTLDPAIVLESAFLHIKDQPKPIEVYAHPILLKLRKRWRYKLQIRFYVGMPLEGCYFEEKIDMVHKRYQQTSSVAALQPRDEPYIIDLPETRVKCKLVDKNGNVLFAVRFIYDVR